MEDDQIVACFGSVMNTQYRRYPKNTFARQTRIRIKLLSVLLHKPLKCCINSHAQTECCVPCNNVAQIGSKLINVATF